MNQSPEQENSTESLPLTKEHPAYLKLAEKIRELEADGIAPDNDEYVTEVERFVRAEPKLAAELAKGNKYLNNIISRMGGELDQIAPAHSNESESVINIEVLHKRAFGTAQEMRQICNKLAIELKSRADNRLTPLIPEGNLKGLYHSVQPFEDALSSNRTEQAVEAIKTIVRAISSIEKGYSPRVSEDTESLKKLGFYLREFSEKSDKLARVYSEVDTPEALEICREALRLKDVTNEKIQLAAQLYQVFSDR